jgi:hypothetical protein
MPVSTRSKGKGIGYHSASLITSWDFASALTSNVLFAPPIDRKHRHLGECRGLEMGPKTSPSFERSFSPLSSTLHARHLSISSHECCASSACHRRFNYKCSRLLAFPCTKYHFFKSLGMTRPQYSESSAARLGSSILAGLLLSQYHESL